jgi:hypothetical protein
MKFTRALLALGAALAAMPLAANDPGTAGFAIVSSSGGVDVMKHESGLTVEFSRGADPDPADLERLALMAKVVSSWKRIRVQRVRAVAERGTVNAAIAVTSVDAGGADISGTLPSGMQLSVASYVSYDFRMKVGDYFIKIMGPYLSEDALLGLMAAAVADPVKYIREHDEGYLFERYIEVSEHVMELAAAQEDVRYDIATSLNRSAFSAPKPIPVELVEKLKALKAETPSLDRAKALRALKASGIAASAKQVDIVFLVYFEE